MSLNKARLAAYINCTNPPEAISETPGFYRFFWTQKVAKHFQLCFHQSTTVVCEIVLFANHPPVDFLSTFRSGFHPPPNGACQGSWSDARARAAIKASASNISPIASWNQRVLTGPAISWHLKGGERKLEESMLHASKCQKDCPYIWVFKSGGNLFSRCSVARIACMGVLELRLTTNPGSASDHKQIQKLHVNVKVSLSIFEYLKVFRNDVTTLALEHTAELQTHQIRLETAWRKQTTLN